MLEDKRSALQADLRSDPKDSSPKQHRNFEVGPRRAQPQFTKNLGVAETLESMLKEFGAHPTRHLPENYTLLSQSELKRLDDIQILEHMLGCVARNGKLHPKVEENLRVGLEVILHRAKDPYVRSAAEILMYSFANKSMGTYYAPNAAMVLDFTRGRPLPKPLPGYYYPPEIAALFTQLEEHMKIVPKDVERREQAKHGNSVRFSSYMERELNRVPSNPQVERAARDELRYHLSELKKLMHEKWSPPSSAPPLEALKFIQNYFENNFQYKSEYQASLTDGIVSHALDCDTLSALILEVGKQVGIQIQPVLISAASNGGMNHVILAIKDEQGKLVFWDCMSTHNEEGQEPRHDYKSFDELKRRMDKFMPNLLVNEQQIKVASEEEFLKRKG